MKGLSLIIFYSLIFSLWGCSHRTLSQKKVSTPEKQELLSRAAQEMAIQKLDQLVREAKSNQSMVSYLSTDLFLKGNMALLDGDFVTAAVLFKYLLILVPDDVFLQKKYAVTLIRAGDMIEAEKVLAVLYKKQAEEKVGLILAGVYTGNDKEKEARLVYQQILKKNPKNEDACIFLSKSYALEKNFSRAISLLQGCSKSDPKNGMYDYYLGKIYVDQGKVQKGMASFEKAYVRQPTLSSVVTALGLMYEAQDRKEKAIQFYRRHVKKSPEDSVVLARLVQLLFEQEKFSEVIPYAEALSDLEPDNLNLKVKLGVLYTDSKQYTEAISVFKDLLKAAPQSDKIMYYLGAIYQEIGKFEEAIEYFNQIQPSSGLYTDSAIQIANMLSSLAQVSHGEEGLRWQEKFLTHVNRKVEEFKDLRVEFSVVKAGFYESVGKFKEAMETMASVQYEESFSTQHKYYLANLYEREKRFKESTELILGILEKEPKNAHAWNFLGYAMLVRGEEMSKAFEYIQKALMLSPDDAYIRDSLGWYYFKTGDTEKALKELELANKKVPGDVEILKHLAQIHMELRNYSKAKGFLESALKNARYALDRKEIQTTLETLESSRLPASGQE